MLSEYKKLIAIFGLVSFLVSCLFTVSFARDRRDSYKTQRQIQYGDSFRHYQESRDRHNDSDDDDRYDRGDSDSDSDDDDIIVPVPVPPNTDTNDQAAADAAAQAALGNQVYNNICAGCHGQSKYGNNVPSRTHKGISLTSEQQAAVNSL